MAYNICKIKNLTGETTILNGHEFTTAEVYTIQDVVRTTWMNSDAVLTAIADQDFEIHDSSGAISGISNQIDWLKDKAPIDVVPSAPKNEHTVVPFGLLSAQIDTSDQCHDITLSNKSGLTYDYTCATTTPEFMDCITQDSGHTRDGIYSESSGSITTYYGHLANGSATLSRPVNIDFKLPTNLGKDYFYFWGLTFDCEQHGAKDTLRIQIIDIDNVLGYGANTIISDYDELWVHSIDKFTGPLKTPDGAPGELYKGLYIRCKYYAKDVTKTNVEPLLDHIVTVKD